MPTIQPVRSAPAPQYTPMPDPFQILQQSLNQATASRTASRRAEFDEARMAQIQTQKRSDQVMDEFALSQVIGLQGRLTTNEIKEDPIAQYNIRRDILQILGGADDSEDIQKIQQNSLKQIRRMANPALQNAYLQNIEELKRVQVEFTNSSTGVKEMIYMSQIASNLDNEGLRNTMLDKSNPADLERYAARNSNSVYYDRATSTLLGPKGTRMMQARESGIAAMMAKGATREGAEESFLRAAETLGNENKFLEQFNDLDVLGFGRVMLASAKTDPAAYAAAMPVLTTLQALDRGSKTMKDDLGRDVSIDPQDRSNRNRSAASLLHTFEKQNPGFLDLHGGGLINHFANTDLTPTALTEYLGANERTFKAEQVLLRTLGPDGKDIISSIGPNADFVNDALTIESTKADGSDAIMALALKDLNMRNVLQPLVNQDGMTGTTLNGVMTSLQRLQGSTAGYRDIALRHLEINPHLTAKDTQIYLEGLVKAVPHREALDVKHHAAFDQIISNPQWRGSVAPQDAVEFAKSHVLLQEHGQPGLQNVEGQLAAALGDKTGVTMGPVAVKLITEWGQKFEVARATNPKLTPEKFLPELHFDEGVVAETIDIARDINQSTVLGPFFGPREPTAGGDKWHQLGSKEIGFTTNPEEWILTGQILLEEKENELDTLGTGVPGVTRKVKSNIGNQPVTLDEQFEAMIYGPISDRTTGARDGTQGGEEVREFLTGLKGKYSKAALYQMFMGAENIPVQGRRSILKYLMDGEKLDNVRAVFGRLGSRLEPSDGTTRPEDGTIIRLSGPALRTINGVDEDIARNTRQAFEPRTNREITAGDLRKYLDGTASEYLEVMGLTHPDPVALELDRREDAEEDVGLDFEAGGSVGNLQDAIRRRLYSDAADIEQRVADQIEQKYGLEGATLAHGVAEFGDWWSGERGTEGAMEAGKQRRETERRLAGYEEAERQRRRRSGERGGSFQWRAGITEEGGPIAEAIWGWLQRRPETIYSWVTRNDAKRGADRIKFLAAEVARAGYLGSTELRDMVPSEVRLLEVLRTEYPSLAGDEPEGSGEGLDYYINAAGEQQQLGAEKLGQLVDLVMEGLKGPILSNSPEGMEVAGELSQAPEPVTVGGTARERSARNQQIREGRERARRAQPVESEEIPVEAVEPLPLSDPNRPDNRTPAAKRMDEIAVDSALERAGITEADLRLLQAEGITITGVPEGP